MIYVRGRVSTVTVTGPDRQGFLIGSAADPISGDDPLRPEFAGHRTLPIVAASVAPIGFELGVVEFAAGPCDR
jgi:hypothetical protein